MGGKARLNIPHDEEPLERRKIPRKWSLLPATLETPAGSFECRVLNLSPRGAKVELAQPLAEHQTVTLLLPPLGAFLGVVLWRRRGCVGIRIHEHRRTTARCRMTLRGGRSPA